MTTQAGEHHVVIQPHRGWRGVDWKEIREYRDLLVFMTLRNIKVRYAQSAIGVGWAVLQPIASMLVFTVIFGKLVGVKTDGATPYAVFTFTALVPWTYFANTLTECSGTMVTNAHIVSKIYFPRLILPMAAIGAKLVDFAIALVVLAILMATYGVVPNLLVVFLPLLVVIMTMTAAGLGLALTALAIQYRDVAYGMQFAVQLLMYAAPVVYPASLVPGEYQYIYALNPMVGVIEGFRAALLGSRAMPWDLIAIGASVACVLLIVGVAYFRRKEHVFADVA
jgi:lipopolysaccharide transport system permease protein